MSSGVQLQRPLPVPSFQPVEAPSNRPSQPVRPPHLRSRINSLEQERSCCNRFINGINRYFRSLYLGLIHFLRTGLFMYIKMPYYIIRSFCRAGVEMVRCSRPSQERVPRPASLLRSLIQSPVSIGPEVGMDPRINVHHFRELRSLQSDIPEPQNVNIRDLLHHFDQLNITDPEHPLYVEPHVLNDEDTPATFAELRAGLNRLIEGVLNDRYATSATVKKLMKHICATIGEATAQNKIDTLLGLARAGVRECNMRMMQESRAGYERLSGNVSDQTIDAHVNRILSQTIYGVLQRISGGDVHALGEIIVSLGPILGIQFEAAGFNNDPIDMEDFAPAITLPRFFELYNSRKMIEALESAINGIGRQGQPWIRLNTQIPGNLVANWFRENLPPGYRQDLPEDERAESFMNNFVYNTETNTVKTLAIEYMLFKMRKFNR